MIFTRLSTFKRAAMAYPSPVPSPSTLVLYTMCSVHVDGIRAMVELLYIIKYNQKSGNRSHKKGK